MIEQAVLGPKLEPPRGGMLRLQQSVRRSEVHPAQIRNWLAAGVAASVVVLIVLFVARNVIQQRRVQIAIRQTLLAPPQTHFDNSAYLVLPSHDPSVQIILIGSLPSQQSATGDRSD